ncbi:ABC transporter ATP-binding protein [Fusobacterium perfoetens]|uniref:ABC transporter ATP-binding protein n=1 Tax=Fusobacterium perfoetens TaxID=852 RepID=UPI0015A4053D|nr:ABC transporter ATP-binding protein [Fusobacterium perfoetens]MCF2625559.1 ABC transporter ATP-binding protein [Fusobacterium perfoetens]
MIKEKLNQVYKSDALGGFLKYSLRYKGWLIWTIFISSLSSALGAAPAWLTKYLVDDVLISKNGKTMILIGAAIFITTVLKLVTAYYSSTTSSYLTEKIRRDIKIDIFEHIENLPMSYFTQNKLGDIMARLSGDSSSLGKIGFLLFEMLKEFVTVLIFLVRMFQVDFILALVSITVLPSMLAVVKKYTKKMRKSGKIRQDTIGQATAFMQESLAGIQVIKGFNKTDMVISKYKEVTLGEMERTYRTQKIKAKISPLNELLATTMVLLVAAYGGYQIVYTGSITAGDLISFITAIGLMQSPLKKLISRNSELYEIIPSGDRVMEVLKEAKEVDSYIENPKTFDENIQSVKFENVDFIYPNSDAKVLKNINLKVNKGEVVAFVGSSGSGKTTLVNMIPRFYDPVSGSIKINDIDIREYSLKDFRGHIGMVPQETFLFSGTIAENISFGKEGITRDEIEKAAKMANAYNFIIDLEKGFETEVGERGVLLSGGQKQRIAIARALIQNPSIMILDEATSALDTESERLVQDALEKLMVGRTTFVIAHRLSTIVGADKIVVMEKGEIKEIGTHEELLAKNGIYTRLYNIQFNRNEELKLNRETVG